MHNILTINTLTQIPDFTRRKFHLITAVNSIHHHRELKNKKPSPLTRCATTFCGIPVKR